MAEHLIYTALSSRLENVCTTQELVGVEREVAQAIESFDTPKLVIDRGFPYLASDIERAVASRTWPARSVHADLVPPEEARRVAREEAAEGAPIDQALSKVQASFAQALEQGGLSPAVVSTILVLVNITAEAQLAKQQIALKRDELTPASTQQRGTGVRPAARDPLEPLSAAALGKLLGLHEASVRSRERAGALFSVLREGRKRGQEFPAFQAFPGVAGTALEQTLAALVPPGSTGPVEGPVAYGFFTSPTDLLADLAPVEVLLGRKLSQRSVDPAADDVLQQPHEARLQLVIDTARAIATSENA